MVAKTLQQLTERRANRLQEIKKRGLLEGEGEERVTVMTCTGGPCKPCDSFVYLGTRVATDARAMGEIKRRIQRAWVTMGELDSVWISRQIGRVCDLDDGQKKMRNWTKQQPEDPQHREYLSLRKIGMHRLQSSSTQ